MTQQKTIAIYERNSWWYPELQRQFLHESLRVHRAHSLQEALASHGNRRYSLVILQMDADPADCLRGLWQRMELDVRMPVIVIHSPKLSALEWSVRELGVTEFLPETISGEKLSRVIRWMTQ